MIIIDGSFGEGGGQILRTSLGLSAVTGNSFKINNIRANRNKPGLMKQHLASVNAAAEICSADVEGNFIGSKELSFRPGKASGGKYIFRIGSAGSTTLVLQTILPVILNSAEDYEIIIEGGTHNPFSPPFDFLKDSFCGILNKMGFKIDVEIIRHGFYPAGGGCIKAVIKKHTALNCLELNDSSINKIEAVSIIANLPYKIAESEIKIIANDFNLKKEDYRTSIVNSDGPGNAVILKAVNNDLTNTFTAFGEKGIKLEEVCENLKTQVNSFFVSGACADEHLQDQLLIPMAFAGGSFTTLKPSLHTLTNIDVIKKFIDINIKCSMIKEDLYEIKIIKQGDK